VVSTQKHGSGDLPSHARKRTATVEVEAVHELVVEDVETGFCGAVVRVEKTPGGYTVTLEDRHGKHRVFPLGPGFLLEGKPATLIRPKPAAPPESKSGRNIRTASGSIAVNGLRAQVAKAGRIYVEGKHDAELVERVWGDDLRIEGVVVEMLGGVDELHEIAAEFQPGPGRKLGVLLDHLVPNSKETRTADRLQRGREDCILVLGHPYVDIWQAVKPSSVGIAAWPVVPRSEEWKDGVCERLHRKDPTWPLESRQAWARILGKVKTYKDLEPALLGPVEALIDFVTAP
jgi:Protein of unknown function (DUF3097)